MTLTFIKSTLQNFANLSFFPFSRLYKFVNVFEVVMENLNLFYELLLFLF